MYMHATLNFFRVDYLMRISNIKHREYGKATALVKVVWCVILSMSGIFSSYLIRSGIPLGDVIRKTAFPNTQNRT